jgi:hypothetical protein
MTHECRSLYGEKEGKQQQYLPQLSTESWNSITSEPFMLSCCLEDFQFLYAQAL